MKIIKVKNIEISNNLPFVFIGGPCAIESREHSLFMCEEVKQICDELKIPFIFKSSFDKANRSSFSSSRGVGMEEGLSILGEVREKFGVPVLTDVHLPSQCEEVAKVVDVLQIPAFLCRQTDLLEAAAKTGKPVNIKKAQFMSPNDMKGVVSKMSHFGSENIMLCERGTCFGYNALVSDFRGLPTMAKTGYPVIFDATHSVQQPSSMGTCSGGEREFVRTLARAAVAVGVAGVFIEVHDNPEKAPCDGPNMVYLKDLKNLLKELQMFDNLAKELNRLS